MFCKCSIISNPKVNERMTWQCDMPQLGVGECPVVGQGSIHQLCLGVGVSGKASWRGFRRDWKDDDLTGVWGPGASDWGGSRTGCKEEPWGPVHPESLLWKEHCVCSDPAGLAVLMVSVTCVPMSAASCPSSGLHNPSHSWGLWGTFKGRMLEGGARSPTWAGLGRAHNLLSPKGSAFHPPQTLCRGSTLSLRLAGNSRLLASARKEGGSSLWSDESLLSLRQDPSVWGTTVTVQLWS